MKILVVINDAMFEDNNEIWLENSAGAFLVNLRKHVDEVTLYHFKMSFGQSRRLADFNMTDAPVQIVNISWTSNKIFNYIRGIFKGYSLLAQADFFYVFYPGHLSKLMCLAAVMQGKKFGMYVRGEKGISSGLSRFFFKRAEVVLTISNQFTEEIKSFGGNAKTIRPMIEYSERDVVPDRQYSSKSFYRLLYVGRLETRKGVFDLIGAIKRMLELGLTNFVLDIVGDGPEADKIKQSVADLGLSDVIVFHGSVSNKARLRSYYLNSDLFVFPSHDEGFPRVLYEASIFGLPIATTFVGTIGYLMKESVNCYRLPLKDPQKMGDLMYDIISNYDSVAQVARKATETIVQYLSDNKYPHEKQLLNSIKIA
jgi:glycosyltransferase involved in cell wall biosynthesis